MPYNPGSAYPRKTVYVPPTYGDTSFQRAVNAPDFSSGGSFGSKAFAGRGRGAYAEASGMAARSSQHPDAAVGLQAMQRDGIVGNLQNRYMEQRGLKQNAMGSWDPAAHGGPGKPDEVKSPAEMAVGRPVAGGAPTHGNPAAIQKRQSATQLADGMVDGVVTGDMPGDTGRANTRKSKKKSNPNQTTLF